MIIRLDKTRLTSSVIALILANLIPIIGILYFGWDAGLILLLYWIENVIVGILNIPKMLMCANHQNRTGAEKAPGFGGALFLSTFFAVHFGFFCFGHWSFLADFLKIQLNPETLLPPSPVFWAILSIALSHLFSFLVNFIGRQEYTKRDPSMQMFLPYSRIFVMHIIIVIGGAAMMALGSPMPGVILLVILKTIIDLTAHNIEHSPDGFKLEQMQKR